MCSLCCLQMFQRSAPAPGNGCMQNLSSLLSSERHFHLNWKQALVLLESSEVLEDCAASDGSEIGKPFFSTVYERQTWTCIRVRCFGKKRLNGHVARFFLAASPQETLTRINLWHFLCIFLCRPATLKGSPSLKIDPQQAFLENLPAKDPEMQPLKLGWHCQRWKKST